MTLSSCGAVVGYASGSCRAHGVTSVGNAATQAAETATGRNSVGRTGGVDTLAVVVLLVFVSAEASGTQGASAHGGVTAIVVLLVANVVVTAKSLVVVAKTARGGVVDARTCAESCASSGCYATGRSAKVVVTVRLVVVVHCCPTGAKSSRADGRIPSKMVLVTAKV